LPSDPEHQVAGILTLRADDWARLSLLGSLTELPAVQDSTAELVIDITDGGLVSLIDCAQSRAQIQLGGVTSQELISGTVVQGVGFESPGEVQFDRAVVRLTHLDEWANLSGFQETYEQDAGASAPSGYSVSYRPPPDREAELPGVKVTLSFSWRTKWDRIQYRRIEQRTELELNLDQAMPLRDLVNGYVQPLRNLLTLAVGAASTVTELRMGRLDLFDPGDRTPRVKVEMPKAFNVDVGKHRSAHEMLFTLADFDFATGIPRWFEVADRLAVVCNLLFGLRYAPPTYAENRLLIANAAAEALHRRLFPDKTPLAKSDYQTLVASILSMVEDEEQRSWLDDKFRHLNQLRLRDRLADLVQFAGPPVAGLIPDPSRWATRVARVRNGLTHWDPSDRGKKLNGTQLYWMANAVAAVVEAGLLRELGFSDDARMALFDRNQQHQHLLAQVQSHLSAVL
jgi:ApeA N-terminal domain 1